MNTEYFSNTFPEIWNRVKDQVVEKEGVFIAEYREGEIWRTVFILFPGLKEEEISLLEKKLEVVFPHEYREFLSHFNGLEFFDFFYIWGKRKEYSEEEYLEQSFDLARNQGEYRKGWAEDIPSNEIIIAGDGAGNNYFLDTNTGKVIERDIESPRKPREFASFNEFLVKIYLEYLESETESEL